MVKPDGNAGLGGFGIGMGYLRCSILRVCLIQAMSVFISAMVPERDQTATKRAVRPTALMIRKMLGASMSSSGEGEKQDGRACGGGGRLGDEDEDDANGNGEQFHDDFLR
jgi:hypothetical protein